MRFLRFSLLFLFIFSCSKQDINHSTLFYFIPENTSIILKTSNIESLKSSIDNNDFLESLSETNTYKNLNKKYISYFYHIINFYEKNRNKIMTQYIS